MRSTRAQAKVMRQLVSEGPCIFLEDVQLGNFEETKQSF